MGILNSTRWRYCLPETRSAGGGQIRQGRNIQNSATETHVFMDRGASGGTSHECDTPLPVPPGYIHNGGTPVVTQLPRLKSIGTEICAFKHLTPSTVSYLKLTSLRK